MLLITIENSLNFSKQYLILLFLIKFTTKNSFWFFFMGDCVHREVMLLGNEDHGIFTQVELQ